MRPFLRAWIVGICCFVFTVSLGAEGPTGKVGTNLLTKEQIATIRQTRRWPGGGDVSGIIAEAERWMKYTPAQLRELAPPPEVPRAFDVHFDQSPTHPEAIKAYGQYPWIIDPDRPYKVISPVDGSVFPTNDFDPKNAGSPSDVSSEPYVDNGWGWKSPNHPQKYWFVAYYAHWIYYRHLIPAAESLAQAYIVTGDQKYARQAIALIDQIAEYYPRMDYQSQSRYGTEIQPGNYEGRILNHIWETNVVKMLARAYDYAYEGMEGDTELEAVTGKSIDQIRRNIEQNLLEEAARSIITQDGRIRGNFGMHQSALATVTIVLDNENTERYLDWVLNATGMGGLWSDEGIIPGLTNFIFRDGAPNESSPEYNSLWIGQFQQVAELLLSRGINLYEQYPKLKLLHDMPLRLVMPGGFTPNIGDTGSVKSKGVAGYNSSLYTTAYQRYGDRAYLSGQPLTTDSDNLSAYGLAMLRYGSESAGVGLSMYYGHGGGHGHFDSLNFEMFAYGQRIMPDLGYPEYASGYHKKRFGWTSNTISHNTVVVNERRQANKEAGRIQAFASTPAVQYVDVRSEDVYPGVVDRYQRALTLVQVSESDAYAVDVFRVKGGYQHDYSLHGPDGTFVPIDIELSEVRPGTLAGEDVPFGYLYDAPNLEAPGYSGPYTSYQGSGFSYLRSVQEGRATDTFSGEWQLRDAPRVRLRVTSLSDSDTQVFVADGEPPLNKPGNPSSLKYMIVRREAEKGTSLESTFVSILQPYRDQVYITEVRRLSQGEGAEDPVALVVQRVDGQDTIYQAVDTTRTFAASGMRFAGRLAVVSRDADNAVRYAYLLDGGLIEQDDLYLSAPGSYEGRVAAIDFGARQVTVRFEKPALGVADVLVGQRIVIFNDEHATEYTIESAVAQDDHIYLLTLGETEFLTAMGQVGTVSSNGRVVSSKTALVLDTYYKGQWLVNPSTGTGRRIAEFAGQGSRITVEAGGTDLRPGDTFHIYDFGIGDRVRIHSQTFVERRKVGEYHVRSNVPVQLRLGDGEQHTLPAGEHTVAVLMPKVVWEHPVPQKGQTVQGEVAIRFTVEAPPSTPVTGVRVWTGETTLYEGDGPPADQLVLDTRTLSDGEHLVNVTLTDALGRKFTDSVELQVKNRWELLDDLIPPVSSAWFVTSFSKTKDESAGWTYATDRIVDFYNDNSRKLRSGAGEQYMTWDASGLDRVEVVVYAREVAHVSAVRLDVADEQGNWNTVEPQVHVEGPNAAGLHRLTLVGTVDFWAQELRLRLLDTLDPDAVHVGQVRMMGQVE